MFLFTLVIIGAILAISGIHFVLALYIAQLMKGNKEKINSLYKRMNKIKGVTSLLVFILSWFGMYQAIQYYLLSGPIFWFVIFSLGLILTIYIAPLSACGISFLKMDKMKWTKFENFHWNLVGFTMWFWGILLILDRETIIYLDEGGVNSRNGNGILKLLGGLGLIVVAIYVSFIIIVKYVNEKNKETESVETKIKEPLIKTFYPKKKISLFVPVNKSVIMMFLPVIIFILLKIVYSILFDRYMLYVWVYDGNYLILMTVMSVLLCAIEYILNKNKFLNTVELFIILILSFAWLMIFWNIYNPLLILGISLFEFDQWYGIQSLITFISQFISLFWLFDKIKKNKGIGI